MRSRRYDDHVRMQAMRSVECPDTCGVRIAYKISGSKSRLTQVISGGFCLAIGRRGWKRRAGKDLLCLALHTPPPKRIDMLDINLFREDRGNDPEMSLFMVT
ncbi:hypothetical protein ACLOJK_033911 [Asimina triloba]